jgi:hypothetical protein
MRFLSTVGEMFRSGYKFEVFSAGIKENRYVQLSIAV